MDWLVSKIKKLELPKWYVFALIFILFLRFGVVGVYMYKNISPSLPQDPLQYKILAINTYLHGHFTLDANQPGNYDILRTPLYPLFLGPFILIDHSGYLISFFQQFFSLITTVFVYLLIFKFTKRKNLSAFLSLIFLLWPYDILWSKMTMSEPLFVFLLLSSTYILLTRENGERDDWAGILAGLMILTRPQGVLFFGIAILYILFTRAPKKMWVYPLIALLVTTPWFLRNFLLTKSITLSSSGVLNMIYGRIAGEEALKEIEILDLKSHMVKDPFGSMETKDWWTYTTDGYKPMKDIIKKADPSIKSIILKNASCSYKVWSVLEFESLLRRFPVLVQELISLGYRLFLLLSTLIMSFGLYLSIRTKNKKYFGIFVLSIGSVLIGTFANMCIAYGRMSIPLIPFLLIAVGLGVHLCLEAKK